MLAVKYRKAVDLIPYINNSRTHSEEQVTQVAASIKEFGFTNPILLDDSGGIIAGHGRLLAAKKLNLSEVPTITLIGLSESQKKAYVIADNQLALNSEWDLDLLKVELERLDELKFDIDLLGFDSDFLSGLMEEEPTNGLTDEDAVPETPENPITVLGDIWILGNHRLMCGDSTSIDAVEKLMDGQKADMVFTDPPYNIDFKDAKGRSIKNDNLAGDFSNFIASALSNMILVSKDAYIYMCFSQKYIKEYLKCIEENNIDNYDLIIWKKDTAMRLGKDYKNYYEPIWLFRIGDVKFYGDRALEHNVWEIRAIHSAGSKDDSGNSWFKGGAENLTQHPTQKPVAVPEKAIKNSSKGGDIVLDLFGGSGSTLIACDKLGRSGFLMELDPKYVDVIINRFESFTGKQAIHAETGKPFNELANG